MFDDKVGTLHSNKLVKPIRRREKVPPHFKNPGAVLDSIMLQESKFVLHKFGFIGVDGEYLLYFYG